MVPSRTGARGARVKLPSRAFLIASTLRALLLVGVLLVPWPGLGHAFGAAFAATSNAVFFRAPIGRVAVEAAPLPAVTSGPAVAGLTPWHVVLTMRSVQTGAATRSALNSRALAYVPFAVVVALCIAVPPRRGARALATALGLAFVGAYVFVGTVAALAIVLADPRIQAVSLGGFEQRLVESVFAATAEASLAAPVALWLLARYVTEVVLERRRAGASRNASRSTAARGMGTFTDSAAASVRRVSLYPRRIANPGASNRRSAIIAEYVL
jgi:hypothetical protein